MDTKGLFLYGKIVDGKRSLLSILTNCPPDTERIAAYNGRIQT